MQPGGQPPPTKQQTTTHITLTAMTQKEIKSVYVGLYGFGKIIRLSDEAGVVMILPVYGLNAGRALVIKSGKAFDAYNVEITEMLKEIPSQYINLVDFEATDLYMEIINK